MALSPHHLLILVKRSTNNNDNNWVTTMIICLCVVLPILIFFAITCCFFWGSGCFRSLSRFHESHTRGSRHTEIPRIATWYNDRPASITRQQQRRASQQRSSYAYTIQEPQWLELQTNENVDRGPFSDSTAMPTTGQVLTLHETPTRQILLHPPPPSRHSSQRQSQRSSNERSSQNSNRDPPLEPRYHDITRSPGRRHSHRSASSQRQSPQYSQDQQMHSPRISHPERHDPHSQRSQRSQQQTRSRSNSGHSNISNVATTRSNNYPIEPNYPASVLHSTGQGTRFSSMDRGRRPSLDINIV